MNYTTYQLTTKGARIQKASALPTTSDMDATIR